MKKKSLRRISLLLILVMAVSFAGCSLKNDRGNDDAKVPAAADGTPEPVMTPEPVNAPSVTEAPSAPQEASVATDPPSPTPDVSTPITVVLRYEGSDVTALSFYTSTVFQLTPVTSDGSSGGSWTSSDASVASVDLYGVVTCYKAGTAKITYTQGEASAACTLTITEPTVAITFGGAVKSDITLKSAWGFEIDLAAVVTPEGSQVTWTSDDATVASVDENGHVTAKRMGTTTVHAKCGTATASCIIRVTENPPTYVAPTPDIDDGTPRVVIVFWGVPNDDFTLKVGDKVQMNYVLYNVEGNPAVTWSIADPDYASVDANGLVTGLKPTAKKDAYHPYTTLIATCGDLKCECIVRVTEAEKVTDG